MGSFFLNFILSKMFHVSCQLYIHLWDSNNYFIHICKTLLHRIGDEGRGVRYVVRSGGVLVCCRGGIPLGGGSSPTMACHAALPFRLQCQYRPCEPAWRLFSLAEGEEKRDVHFSSFPKGIFSVLKEQHPEGLLWSWRHGTFQNTPIPALCLGWEFFESCLFLSPVLSAFSKNYSNISGTSGTIFVAQHYCVFIHFKNIFLLFQVGSHRK